MAEAVNEAIDSIMTQTGEQDRLYIEKVFYECNHDVVSTVLKILDKDDITPKQTRNMFDDMRDILDAKATVFQNMLESQRRKT